MRLGCIADDLTGATDLANELVARGLRTVQIIGIPDGALSLDADAVVIALKSRSVDAALAASESLAALRWLQEAGCPRFYFKYCSTFDSTPQGNIGPVLEALAQELGTSAVIACPAFPAAGRTVYQGHLFVGNRLLNESGMQHHPITPMTDADLVRILTRQMKGDVGLLCHREIVAGRTSGQMDAFLSAGVGAVIADAVSDEDLEALGAWCATAPLSSGGSGLGAGIATAMAGKAARRASATFPTQIGALAIVSGSCSTATRRQVATARAAYPSFRVAIAADQTPEEVVNAGKVWINQQSLALPLLLFSTASPEEVAAQREIWPDDVSATLEMILAELSEYLIEKGVGALVVAGGETSGAVVQRLHCDRLEIGPEIDPGVPWTVGRRPDGSSLLLALKSGNFGTDDFMIKAWEHLA
ncbi:four-carbon acid sugar kinase family protein [Sphingobium sp. H39-3-25]|uniref:3-oxo-tetronate kinase n=1 Tax=Sphingobium arseniciresistens TaxID=3030834 RepID=UPI0023B88DAD|nr:four-carbon acid sugar kinase family protein [Sphingobium arseniciresistens]